MYKKIQVTQTYNANYIKYLSIYAEILTILFRNYSDNDWYLFLYVLQVWFQNRRAKWKKRKKTTNVFRSSGSLLPSHGLPPFGPMSSDLCSGMFHTPADRWGMGTGQISIVSFITNRVQEMIGKKKRSLVTEKWHLKMTFSYARRFMKSLQKYVLSERKSFV